MAVTLTTGEDCPARAGRGRWLGGDEFVFSQASPMIQRMTYDWDDVSARYCYGGANGDVALFRLDASRERFDELCAREDFRRCDSLRKIDFHLVLVGCAGLPSDIIKIRSKPAEVKRKED